MGEAGPPSPLSSSVPSESVSGFIVYTSLSRRLSLSVSLFPSFSPEPSLLCYCSSEDGVGSDKVLGLIDEQSWRLDERMDEGRGGSLTQANRETERTDLLGYAATHSPAAI